MFIELVKPVMASSSSEEGAEAEKQAFRETLWTCLDTGLRYGCMTTRLVRDLIPWHTYCAALVHSLHEVAVICSHHTLEEPPQEMCGVSWAYHRLGRWLKRGTERVQLLWLCTLPSALCCQG